MRIAKKLLNKIMVSAMNDTQYINYLRKKGVLVGDGCVINKTAEIGSEPYLIKIGNKVRITQGVKFITHDGGLWVIRNAGLIDSRADRIEGIEIGDNVNIGWDAIILPGVKIGNNCVIGCGAVVTHDVPDNSVAIGVPARVIETIEEYAEKAKEKVIFTKGLNGKEKKQALINMGKLRNY